MLKLGAAIAVIASEVISFGIEIADSQPDKSLQARQSVNISLYLLARMLLALILLHLQTFSRPPVFPTPPDQITLSRHWANTWMTPVLYLQAQ